MVDRVVEHGFHLDALVIDFHPIVNQTQSMAVVRVPVYMPAIDGLNRTPIPVVPTIDRNLVSFFQ